jgi:hypothetical protein
MAVTAKVFASDVDGGVQKLLNTRKAYYSAQFRDSGAHAWILQKTAFARASATTRASGRSAVIDVPTQGGIKGGGLYASSGTQRFTPKSHIVSVKIGNEGKWGSTKRCELSFAAYSLSALDALQPFLTVGSEVTVNVGWNDAGGAAGPGLVFKGIVYNFSYNLNANGGFDCTCEAISEGILAASLRVGGEFDTGTEPPPPPSDGDSETKAAANNLLSLLSQEITKITSGDTLAAELQPETAIKLDSYAFPIVAVAYKLKRTAEGREEADGDADDAEEPAEPIFYVTLETVVDLINQMLSKSGLTFKYICNSTVTNSKVDPDMRSANPLVLMIPGRMDYGEDFTITDTGYEADVESGDFSKILMSVDWLLKTSEEYQKSIGAQLPQDANQIDTFFQKIFEMIKTYTGSYHMLSLVTDPKENNPKEWNIVDSNAIDSTVNPYVFEVGTKRSMVRGVQLNTKIPSKFAAAAYIAAKDPGKSVTSDVHVSPAILDAAKSETVFDTSQLVNYASDLINDISEQNINKMSAFLSKLKASKPSGTAPNNLQPAAFDLSITIDGVEGIVFGNTVSTNYIPSLYAKDVYFTVTNVEHSISNNDWTTTLSTVMRMK